MIEKEGVSSTKLSRPKSPNLPNTTRDLVLQIQQLAYEKSATEQLFPLFLKSLLKLTHSQKGSVYTSLNTSGAFPLMAQNNDIACLASTQEAPFVNTKQLANWLESDSVINKPTWVERGDGSELNALLLKETQEPFLIVPLYSYRKLKAVAFVLVDQALTMPVVEESIAPILGATIYVMNTIDITKGKMKGMDAKIQENLYLSNLIARSPTAIIIIDENEQVITSNLAAENMFFGMQDDEFFIFEESQFCNAQIRRFIPLVQQYIEHAKRPISDVNSNAGQRNDFKAVRVLDEQNEEFFVSMSIFSHKTGPKTYYTLQMIDLTEQHQTTTNYELAAQQLNALTQLVPVAIIRVDANWNCVYVNDKWYDYTGLSQEESLGVDWINAFHNKEVETTLKQMREALKAGENHQQELRLVSPLGQERWVDCNMQVLFDTEGKIEGFLATFADITDRLIQEERLRHVAEYDSLTGLANRNLFQDRLQQALYHCDRETSEVVVLFLDLDGFKDINDTKGHDAGDLLLQQVANRLLNTLRRGDTVARFGGDEFVVLLEVNEDNEDVGALSQKIITSIAKPYVIQGCEIFITVSVGVATSKGSECSPDQLLKQADSALYLAKAEGKNTYKQFDLELNLKAKSRMDLLNYLRTALQERRFYLAFQQQARVSDNEVVGCEVLLRLQGTDSKEIPCEDFIPLLEESGLITEVGDWLIIDSCRQLSEWQSAGEFPKNGFISINVSPKQILEGTFVDAIKHGCQKYKINPNQIVIEVTESVIIDRPQKAQTLMVELKKLGTRLALDDFGTGYSSLSYLQQYPFDHIKIDKSFVQHLSLNKNDAKITKSIIVLAKSLGLKVTAEGIEDSESLEVIKSYGADFYQGYLKSKPQRGATLFKS